MTPKTRTRRATDAEQAQAAHALLSAVLGHGAAGTDEAHARYELPEAVDQRAWGTVTMRLTADGILQRIGDRHTRRSVAHGRRIGVYVAPDPERAREHCERLAAGAARPRERQLPLFDGADPAETTGPTL